MLPGVRSGQARFIAVVAFLALPFIVATGSIAEIRVTDDLGREVVMQQPAQRIVSLAPHNTENLFTAGAGGQIVGTVDHSDYPEQALDIPRVGNYTQVNIEAILKLKPDLIVAWSSGNTDQSTERLVDLGVPVFYSEPTTFEKIIGNIESLARLSGQSKKAEPQVAEMRDMLHQLENTYSNKAPVRIFYQVWNEPLITLNGEHSVSRAFDICSGTNVFKDEPSIAPRINIEGVIAKNPQLILLAGHNEARAEDWRQTWEKWPAINAVANHQVLYVNPDIVNRPTRRFFDATREICELIEVTRGQLVK